MVRPRTVYRGKRKYGWIVTLLVSLLVLALVALVWLFYYMQKFIVYDKDDLRLVLPYMDDYAPHDPVQLAPSVPSAPVLGNIQVEIVVDERDYSDLVTDAGADLSPLRARRISASGLSAAAIAMAANDMGDYNALVLQLKDAGGMLAYKSALPIADSYAVNGTEDISGAVALAKDSGVYLAAEISSLQDTAMALRYAPAALKNASSGATLDIGGQSWLDPYSSVTRGYMSDLMAELAGMGFDEIIFTGLTFPESELVAFSSPMTGSPGAGGCIASFSLYLREEADRLGIKISGQMDAARLRSGTGGDIGQDPEIFFKAFDRIVIPTDAYTAAFDAELLRDVLMSDGDERIVPMIAGGSVDSGCYIVG